MGRVGKIKKIEKTTNKITLEDLPLPDPNKTHIEEIAHILTKKIDKEVWRNKYANAASVLKLVGAGAFVAASIAIPTLPQIIKPFLKSEDYFEIWKRFNIPYLKRTLFRLERQKLVKIKAGGKYQTVEITDRGRRKILKYAIDELVIEKPKFWDGKWRLVSYDIPSNSAHLRDIFREYLKVWKFYPLHESMFLHAYPCGKQIEFLSENT